MCLLNILTPEVVSPHFGLPGHEVTVWHTCSSDLYTTSISMWRITPLYVQVSGVGREGLARVVRGGDWVFLVTNNDLRLFGGLGLEILPATSLQPSSHDDQVSFFHTGTGTQ